MTELHPVPCTHLPLPPARDVLIEGVRQLHPVDEGAHPPLPPGDSPDPSVPRFHLSLTQLACQLALGSEGHWPADRGL